MRFDFIHIGFKIILAIPYNLLVFSLNQLVNIYHQQQKQPAEIFIGIVLILLSKLERNSTLMTLSLPVHNGVCLSVYLGLLDFSLISIL
jgi:hypothetical protein